MKTTKSRMFLIRLQAGAFHTYQIAMLIFWQSYLISPRTCHRFVGYLEEEAVLTYSLCIEDLEAGKLPQWSDPDFKVPELAVNYWNMPEGHRTMRDLLLYIRADEAKHREVNHTLGNLKQNEDPNPFVSSYKDSSTPHPGKGIEHIKPLGWEREEVI
jgi:hypothetical protein